MKHLKKHLTKLALLAIAAMLPQLASAFNIDGIVYEINSYGNSVTVTGFSADLPNNLVIPSTVTYGGETFSVTSIGDLAFGGCSGLTSLTIPNSVTSIGYNAFYNCSGLTSVTIGNSVTSIGWDAFSGCTGLTAVYINDLEAWCNIGFDDWWFNTDLFVAPLSNPLIQAHHLFLNGEEVINLVIPETVSTIKAFTFAGCSGLKSVTIPNSVASIDVGAFEGCNKLTSVHISSLEAWYNINFGLTYSVGDDDFFNIILSSNPLTQAHHLFLNGEEVVNLEIPETITKIKDLSFAGCSGLEAVTIPNSVTSIGTGAFEGCSTLPLVTVPNTVTTIGNSAFEGCSGLTSVAIPNSVTSMGDMIFRGCGSLTSVTIPNSVTEIGKHAFQWCRGLTSVTIPNSVTSIGGNAFSGCSGLTSVTIPNSVTSIGSSAFSGCSGLTSIYSKIKKPQSVSYGYFDIFSGVPSSLCTLYIPKGTYDTYCIAYLWSDFTNIIEMDASGDVNYDGNVNVTDYVAMAGYILEMNPQPFYFEEGDLDENGSITVGDLVGVATRVLSFEGNAPQCIMQNSQCTMHNSQCITQNEQCSMGAVVQDNKVIINLSNNVDITAFQMDLNLPEGMTLVDASLSDRASSSHQVAFNQLENGDYRLLASSPMCKSFSGNDGVVLTLTLAGEPFGSGIVRNIELATPRAASFTVDDIELNFETTGVETVKTSNARIYNEGGNIIIDSPTANTAQIILPNGMTQTVTVTAGKNIFPAPASGVIIVKMGDSIKKLLIK